MRPPLFACLTVGKLWVFHQKPFSICSFLSHFAFASCIKKDSKILISSAAGLFDLRHAFSRLVSQCKDSVDENFSSKRNEKNRIYSTLRDCKKLWHARHATTKRRDTQKRTSYKDMPSHILASPRKRGVGVLFEPTRQARPPSRYSSLAFRNARRLAAFGGRAVSGVIAISLPQIVDVLAP